MKRLQVLLAIAACLVALSSCREEPAVEVLDEYESADLAARAWSFQVYPGATFLPAFTDAYRRSHSILNPDSPEAPPIAVYETDDPVEEVAAFYVDTYGYGTVDHEPDDQEDPAYFTTGDLGVDTRNIADLLAELGYEHDLSRIEGEWRGAHIAPTGPYPRVTIQRPYYHFDTGEIRDRTLILMVRE